VEFHLEALAADGDIIPKPRTTSVDFAQDDPEHGVMSCIVSGSRSKSRRCRAWR